MWGGAWMKRRLWNREFAGGHWDFIENAADDPIYPVLERFCGGGAILDLGCGAGNTVNEIGKEAFGHYTGVDISDVALAKAAEWAARTGRESKVEFHQAAIEAFEADRKYEVVLFRESLFYIPVGRVVEVLEHYQKFLAPDGVIIVRMYDGGKYDAMVQIIRDRFEVREEQEVDGGPALIMVFC